MKSIYNHLVDWGISDPDFIFLNYNKSYTINDVLYQVETLSKPLKYIPDDYIGIHINSSIDTIFLYLACIKNNKTPILIPTTISKSQLDYLISHYQIKHIISEWISKSLFDQGSVIYYLEELINSSRGCGVSPNSNSNSNPESILFTSGSMGHPKAVSLDLKNFYHSSLAWNKKIEFNFNDSYLLCLPLYHISGLSILYRAIYCKFNICIIDSYRDIPSNSGTIISLVPSLLHRLIKDASNIDKLSSLRAIIIGGEPADLSLLEKSLEMDLNIFICYGMTETCSGIAGFWIKNHPNKLSSAGQPFDGVDISIEKGYIAIDSNMNMRGYYMDKDCNSKIITSDLGNIENNFIYVTGREKNIAISGGENINTDYVKNILLKHNAIQSVSIKINKDIKWGEIIEADLEVNTNKVSIQDIKDWCHTHIPRYAIPKIMRIVTK